MAQSDLGAKLTCPFCRHLFHNAHGRDNIHGIYQVTHTRSHQYLCQGGVSDGNSRNAVTVSPDRTVATIRYSLQFWAVTNYPPLKIKFLRVGKAPPASAWTRQVQEQWYLSRLNFDKKRDTQLCRLSVHKRLYSSDAYGALLMRRPYCSAAGDKDANIAIVDLLEYCKCVPPPQRAAQAQN